ncbi:unnamed protein product [Tetraodon nigroviridis]|uniref:Protein GOLM2 n=1 Tax=Tetraodon nigroviridis TaxID=99883 RepID=Q4STN0_TETNG|nr:unnamed protein product [Tetraodon nigroviridis]
MIGFGGNRRGGRLPSFILIFLMVVIAILSFNYYTVSSRQGRLLDELAEVHSQVKRTDAARSAWEKRNSELMVQVDTHKKQMEQRDGDYSALESKLQAREALGKKCTDEKMKLQDDVTSQMTEIHRLKEQLTELKQELMKKEDQLREVKKNSTNLEKKLEYESLQCGRQMAQLKKEYEETKKTLEDEATKLRQVGVAGTDEHRSVATQTNTKETSHCGSLDGRSCLASSVTDEMGKPGGDAGMPAIEDSEVGKPEDNQFALRKPAITQKRHQAQEVGAAGAGAPTAPGPRAWPWTCRGSSRTGWRAEPWARRRQRPGRQRERWFSRKTTRLQSKRTSWENSRDKYKVKRPLNASRCVRVLLSGQQMCFSAAPEAKDEGGQVKGIPLPLNPDQLPKPIQPHQARDQVPPEAVHHRQSRFFDENESPVDPQHGSKLADYNGDDGNVGEYEADKQAELAYNEEEDGDGGEEDVQGEPGSGGWICLSRCVIHHRCLHPSTPVSPPLCTCLRGGGSGSQDPEFTLTQARPVGSGFSRWAVGLALL